MTRVDWFRILQDLKESGWSLYRVQEEIDIPKTTLIGYKSGAEPRHKDGEKLIGLWVRITVMPRDAIPMQADELSASSFRR